MSQRLFFALWPDAAVRRAIAAVAQQAALQHRGKRVATHNLHMTLAFLGNIDDAQCDCITAMASTLSVAAFELCLGHTGVFPRAKVLWLGCEKRPAAMLQLATSLAEGARQCGIALDDKDFHPHVTLLRKVDRRHELVVEPVRWPVDSFCLVRSVTYAEGVSYEVIETWRLLPVS